MIVHRTQLTLKEFIEMLVRNASIKHLTHTLPMRVR